MTYDVSRIEKFRLMNSITIITATFNAQEDLPTLVNSLRNQSDKNFVWIVADGGSSDRTVEYLNSIDDLNITLTVEKDFGIYDALNRAIKICSSEYYIVIGADDYFFPDAISNYRASIEANNKPELLALGINYSGVIKIPKKHRANAWLKGQMAYIAGHAVGLAIKTDLHKTVGLYSNKFPIAADQYFIGKAVNEGARIAYSDDIAGYFSTDGLSSVDVAGTVTEFFRVQVLLGFNKYVQIVLLCLRLLKNASKI